MTGINKEIRAQTRQSFNKIKTEGFSQLAMKTN